MSDIIKILPDHIANQIAAGEVIQRPASVVKELLENAIDAGSTEIKLVLKDAGKALIQVIDNGKGMSANDALVCFERHATSKLSLAEDLFKIKTKGFRGEAMASIASVAQVELDSKRLDDSLGNHIEIHGSKIISKSPIACVAGTNIQVKNLFFNIPARRKFLKSDKAELRHCLEEFERVALVHPEVSMTMIHQEEMLHQMPASNLKKRIVQLMGKTYESLLMPIQELTDVVEIQGFIIKPSHSKKTKGDQFLFVNDRFIKHAYFHHAIKSAFQELIPEDHQPGYFIYLQVPLDKIDINIHPSKTEVKFEEDQIIYSILRSAVKRSIGQFGIGNSLDFNPEMSFAPPVFSKDREVVFPKITSNPGYNPFASFDKIQNQNTTNRVHENDWKDFYQVISNQVLPDQVIPVEKNNNLFSEPEQPAESMFFVLHQKFLVCKVKSGMMFVHIRRAWEKILFARSIKNMEHQISYTQQLLFPVTLEFTAKDFTCVSEAIHDLKILGFDLENFGTNCMIVRGIPEYFEEHLLEDLFQDIILEIQSQQYVAEDLHRAILSKILRKASVGFPSITTSIEKESFLNELFALSNPQVCDDGRKVIHIQSIDEIEKLF